MWNSCIILLCSYSIPSDGCKLLNPGRFKVTLERFEECPGMPPISEQEIPIYIKLQKYNRTTVVANANVTLPRDFDDSYHLHARVARWGDGGWKENWIQFRRRDACHAFKYLLGKFWTALVKDTNDPETLKCPVAKGFYQVVNHRPRVEKNPIPMCEGQIKAEAKLLRDEKISACKLFYYNIEAIL